MMLDLIADAERAGAALGPACAAVGLSVRTVQRWRANPQCEDARRGPRLRPRNALSAEERRKVLDWANSPEFRDLSPKQIVPRLADLGVYVASESTFFRVLREAGQLAHRGRAKAPSPRPVERHVANGPNQVISWDITYLRTAVRGQFFYLYLFMDIWSRKILGWAVHEAESADLAAETFTRICAEHDLDHRQVVLHADNGASMKGATMLATLQKLGVVPSFSRPSVSDDNAFSEALF